MGHEQSGPRARYVPPQIVDLSESGEAMRENCRSGNAATGAGGNCRTGFYAGNNCLSGSTPSNNCNAGSAPGQNCNTGSAPG
jgi:hypothetical protein